jgi:hypothetical protein
MSTFPLPPTSTDHPPAFLNANGCRLWLDELPLANVLQSQALMLRQINLINRYALPAADRFRILECMRVPLSVIQEGSLPRFAGKAMPLAPAEQAAFEATMALWNALVIGYLHGLEAALDGDASLVQEMALVAQRALASLCSTQADTYPGARLPGTEFWKLLHGIYSAVAARGGATTAVEDRLRNGRHMTTPTANYVEALLLHAAGPSETSGRHYGWLVRWAHRWSGKVAVKLIAPEDVKNFPLCVDLDSDQPFIAERSAQLIKDSWRGFDVTELRSSIKKRLVKLADGVPPAELGLGSDCVMPGCHAVLEHVYQRWCKGVPLRKFERRPASGLCRLIGGVDAIHQQFSGKPFLQPGAGLTPRQHDEIALYGQIATHQAPEFAKQSGLMVEEWQLLEEWSQVDESATGLHLTRPLNQPGNRFGSNQLIAARPDNAKQFLLGWLRWIHVGAGNSLHAGAHIFPGVPEAIAVRSRSSALVAEKFRPAFLLPEVAALGLPQRIVLPPGMFRSDLVVEIFREQLYRISLSRLRERGSDFECVEYLAEP